MLEKANCKTSHLLRSVTPGGGRYCQLKKKLDETIGSFSKAFYLKNLGKRTIHFTQLSNSVPPNGKNTKKASLTKNISDYSNLIKQKGVTKN